MASAAATVIFWWKSLKRERYSHIYFILHITSHIMIPFLLHIQMITHTIQSTSGANLSTVSAVVNSIIHTPRDTKFNKMLPFKSSMCVCVCMHVRIYVYVWEFHVARVEISQT